MILGLSTSAFTQLHVLISLVGIASGLVVMYGLLTSKRLDRWTLLFLATTAATSLTGFAFPNAHITPGIVIGVVSLVVLAVAVVARYALQMRGAWRAIYIVTASFALYLNVFVLIAQSFEKIPTLKVLAPTQKEPPFFVAQLLVLALFIVLTAIAVRRFKVNRSIAGTSDSAMRKGEGRAA